LLLFFTTYDITPPILSSGSSPHTNYISSPMPHVTSGTTLDASDVLASRLLDFLSSKRPSAQERLGDRRLDQARDLAQKNGDWISPSDLKIARDKVLQCVLSPRAYPSYARPLSAWRESRHWQDWNQRVAFRNSFKRKNTESLPKRLSVLSRSLFVRWTGWGSKWRKKRRHWHWQSLGSGQLESPGRDNWTTSLAHHLS